MNVPVNIDSFSGGEEKKAKIVMMKYGDKKYFGFIDAEDKCFGYFGTAHHTPKLREADSAKRLKKLINKDCNNKSAWLTAEIIQDRKIDLTTGEFFLTWLKKKQKTKGVKQVRYCGELEKYSKSSARILLALHMLSAIVERKYAKFVHANNVAGIFQIETKRNQIADFMKAVAHSFSCVRKGDKKSLHVVLPNYLPQDNRKDRMKDNAYITDKRTRTLRIPATYQDTAVVMDTRMLKSDDVVKFVQGNDHCQTVMVGNVAGKLNGLAVETIPVQNLAVGEIDWDVAILQQMTQAFTTADIGKKKIKAAIKQAGQLINPYLDKSGTKFSSKLQYKELYLATAVLLIGFLHETDKMTEEETAGLRNLLFNAILSGIYTPPKESGVAPERIALTEENFADALRGVIARAVEDTSKFSVPQDNEWDASDAAPESNCYGYLTGMDVDHTHKNKEPTILFRREVFLDLFERFAPCQTPDRAQAEKWLRGCIKGKGLAYCPDRDRSRDRFGADGSNPSVRLLIRRLDFLAEDKRQELLDAFATKNTPAGK